MYKVYFYVPQTHLESVKKAIFKKGAGSFGGYDSWAWQTLGEGQFRSLEGSHPTIGMANQFTHISEYKVETICEENCLKKVVDALLSAHPYEQPAYGVCKIIRDFPDDG